MSWAGLGDTSWHHLAITADGTNLNFYVDAGLKNTSTQPNLTAWGDLYIGKGSRNMQPWNGKLSDLIILNTNASASDVTNIMNGTYAGMPALPAAPAAGVWTNTASGGMWWSASNWSNNYIATGTNITADFSQLDVTSDNTVHLNQPNTIGSLIFGDTDTNSAAGWILDNNGSDTNVLTLAGASAGFTVTNLGAGKQVTVSAIVAGSGGLTKEGPGTLVLTTNTLSGSFTINGGTVSANLPNNNGLTFNNGGVFEFIGSTANIRLDTSSGSAFNINVTTGNLTVARAAGNYNTIVKDETGTITVANGFYDDGGDLTVNGGTAVLSGATWIGAQYANVGNVTDVKPGAIVKLGNANGGQVYYDYSFHMSGGTFDLNGINGAQVPAIDGSGYISNSVAATTGTGSFKINGTKTFSGNIVDGTGAAAVAVNLSGGGGVWVLSGSNTHSGATTVGAGTLRAGSTTACSPNAAYNVGGGHTLDLNGFNNTIGSLTGGGSVTLGGATLTVGADGTSPANYTGVISGGGSVVKTGAGKIVLAGNNTFGGSVTVSNGTLVLSGNNSYTGAVTVAGGVLALGGSNAWLGVTTVSGGALVVSNTFSLGTNSLYLSGAGQADLEYAGTNALQALYVNGTQQPSGVYGANGSNIVGTGYVLVGGPPPAPASLTATPLNARAQLSWSASADAAGYEVFQSLTSGSGYALIATTASNTTSYLAPNLVNGTPYYFVVAATNGFGAGPYSPEATATPALPAPPAFLPGNGVVVHPGAGTATISFTGTNGWEYLVEYTDDLTPPAAWTNVTGAAWITAASNGTITVTDPAATNAPQRFYRLEVR